MNKLQDPLPLCDRSRRGDLLFISVFFLLGSLVSSFFPALFPDIDVQASLPAMLPPVKAGEHGLRLIWNLSWSFLAAVFLSTSFLGVYLLPLLCFFRGFLLSAAGRIVLQSADRPFQGLVLIGLTAFFSLSAFFLVGEKALGCSRDLHRRVRHGVGDGNYSLTRNCLTFSVILLTFAVISRLYLIPLLQ